MVVLRATEWPTRDYSIKTLAQYLGFNWRDTHPSGAASIEWFDKWVESGNPHVKRRILDYNEMTAGRRGYCWTVSGGLE